MNPYFDLCLCVQLDITKAKLSLMTFAFNQVSPSFESISWVNDIYVTKKKTMCFQSGLNTPVLKALVDSNIPMIDEIHQHYMFSRFHSYFWPNIATFYSIT